ncbi:Superoxide dismutase OS=Streptomyces microflavus OX=1919 GN=G3I39_05710 PE=3 SV=1 [Streptomyces microflavus]
MATYTLPELPYNSPALEPVINPQIVELHHDKHHAAYVKGANDTLEQLEEARDKEAWGAINGLQKNLAFHLSGHILHSIYWHNMTGDGGGKPLAADGVGDLADAITESFGSYAGFKAQLTKASATTQGSGWGVLAYEPLSGKLIVEQVYDHQGNVRPGLGPDPGLRRLGARRGGGGLTRQADERRALART